MTHQQLAFRRKVIYLAIMAALLIPLSLLGLPASGEVDVKPDDTFLEVAQHGRVLAALRQKDGLAQRSLGEIEASSETMKFFALGFRGPAATLLWMRAHEHKKKENWTALHNVLNQIGRIQPNFVKVWRFQAWNLSYNVSAEWDDYRQRYNWVLQGIAYLNKGQQYNRNQTQLIWDEGWSTGHKIGRSDEYRQFRRLFRDRYLFAQSERDMDAYRPRPKPDGGDWDPPDNWLCAKAAFGYAIGLADEGHTRLEGMGEEIYRSEPAKCQMRYAMAIVEEGTFGEVARAAWRQAGQEWDEYGDYVFVSANDGVQVTLNDHDRLPPRVEALRAEIDKLSGKNRSGEEVSGGAIRAALRAQRQKQLNAQELAVLKKPKEELTLEEKVLWDQVTYEKLDVKDREVASALPGSVQPKAYELIAEIDSLLLRQYRAGTKRGILNYGFWKIRCEAETSDESIEARRLLHAAKQAHRKDRASLESVEAYDKAFAKFGEVFAKYPELLQDGELGDQVCDEIRLYKDALKASPSTKKWDKKTFVLRNLIEARSPTPPID